MAQDPRNFLWANICELMGGEPSIDAVQARIKVGRGTVQRIRAGDAAIRISSIHTAADNLGVEVWQLLMPPDLDQLAVIEAAARKKRQQLEPPTTRQLANLMQGAREATQPRVRMVQTPKTAKRGRATPDDKAGKTKK